jgi:uncharacterized protein YyaL (SSP411 family)
MTTQPSQGLPPDVIQELNRQYEAMRKKIREEAKTLVNEMQTQLKKSIEENINSSIQRIAPQSKQVMKSLDREHTGSEVKPEQGLPTVEMAAVRSPPEISKDKLSSSKFTP